MADEQKMMSQTEMAEMGERAFVVNFLNELRMWALRTIHIVRTSKIDPAVREMIVDQFTFLIESLRDTAAVKREEE